MSEQNGSQDGPANETSSQPSSESSRWSGSRKARGMPQEALQVAAENLLKTLRDLVREGNVRRILVRTDRGRTLLDIPLNVGLVGAVLLPAWAAVGAITALATGFTIVVERSAGGDPPTHEVVSGREHE
jgi:Domain of unknown function (DUF4342)